MKNEQNENTQSNQEQLLEADQQVGSSAAQRRLMSTQLRNKIMTFIFIPVILGITISSGISTLFTMLLSDRYSTYANIQLIHQLPTIIRSTNVLDSMFLQQQLQSQVMKLQKMYDYLVDVQNGKVKYIKSQSQIQQIYYNAFEIQQNQSYYLPSTNKILDPSYSCIMWFLDSNIKKFQDIYVLYRNQFQQVLDIYQILRPMTKNSQLANRVYLTIKQGVQFIFPALRDPIFGNYTYNPLSDPVFVQAKEMYYTKSQTLSFYFDYKRNKITACFILQQFIDCNDINALKFCGIICSETTFLQEQIDIILPQIQSINLTSLLVDGLNNTQSVLFSTNKSWIKSNITQELFDQSAISFQQNVQDFEKNLGDYTYAIKNYYNQPFQQGMYMNNDQVNQLSQSQLNFDVVGQTSGIWTSQKSNLYIWVTYLSNQKFQDNVYSSLKDILSNNYYAQIGLISGMFLLLTYISWKQVKQVSFQIMESLSDLLEKVMGIEADDLQLDVMVNFKQSNQEVNKLYETFNDINVVLRCANDDYFVGNEALQLINYSNAIKLFQKTQNNKGLGIAYNNVGNIHMNHNRIDEAIKAYREAVRNAEDSLKQLIQVDSLEAQYDVKPINGWESLNVVRKYQIDGNNIDVNKIFINNKKKTALEQQYANRLYQLSNALIEQAAKEEEPEIKKKIIDEIIDNLSMVEKIDSNHDRTKSREIKVKVKLCNAYLQRGELRQEENSYVESFQYIDKAEQQLMHYDKIYTLFLEEENKDDPPEILMQDIMMQHGIFCEVVGKFREACKYYTKSIIWGKVYEPNIRTQSLHRLKKIFLSQDLLCQAPNINMLIQQIEKKKHKDIVFILDYSQSMEEGNRKKYALVQFLDIFDKYLEDEDRVAYIRFNQNVNVVFELCEKGCNTFYLRKFIQDSIEINADGETSLYQSIYEAYKLFKKCQVKDHQKWILVVTDGQDNSSQISAEILRDLLQKADINLIIVGIMLSKYVAPQLEELCSYSNKNAFIQNILTQDIHIAFQSITNLIFGKLPEERFIVEKFA